MIFFVLSFILRDGFGLKKKEWKGGVGRGSL